MILEGLVTSTDLDGGMHLAPMGPTVDGAEFPSFLLRPFPTSQTCRNLIRTRQGVLHITDDVLLMARAAIGEAGKPAHHPAESVEGFILDDCCRAIEFRIEELDESRERIHLRATVVRTHRVRDFFGFNRAKHAVLEAAIMATRYHLIPAEEVDREMARLRVIVNKTAGPVERDAMALLESKWALRAGR